MSSVLSKPWEKAIKLPNSAVLSKTVFTILPIKSLSPNKVPCNANEPELSKKAFQPNQYLELSLKHKPSSNNVLKNMTRE